MSNSRFAFSIDAKTNDLFVSELGDIATVRDSEAVAQHVRQRLNTYREEWYLDTTVGVPWLEELLGGSYNHALAESVVKAEILGTDLVTSIASFSVGYNRASRGLILKDIVVNTVYDEEVSI